MEKTIREEPWKADGEDKRVAVNSLFADVADSYDLVNSIMSFGLHYRWRKSAVKKIAVQRGDTVLDICCGTGDFLVPLSDAVGPEGTCCGLDFCEPMLDIAKSKLGDKAELTVGDACDLPYDSERFDAATVGWGIRNVPDIPAALSEAHRVLKPGGRFACVDCTQGHKGLGGAVSRFTFHTVVPFIGRVFGKTTAYKYLPESTERFLNAEELKTAMEDAGFADVQYKVVFFGNICTHWGVKK